MRVEMIRPDNCKHKCSHQPLKETLSASLPPSPVCQSGCISVQTPPAPRKRGSSTYTLYWRAKLFHLFHSCGQVQGVPKEHRDIWPVNRQSRWILLAPALGVEWVVNASLEHRKIVTVTKEVLQRVDQEAAKLQRNIWQACLLLLKLTTKGTPRGGENLEQFQHAHVLC